MIPGPSCGPGSGTSWSRLPDRSRSASGPSAAWSVLVFGGPGQGPQDGRWSGPAVLCIRGLGVGAQHVRQRGPHAQDQDRQAGHTIVVIAHGARAIPAWAIRW